MKLFKKKSQPTIIDIPSGVCVSAEGENWYVNKGYRHKIPTKRILDSWSFPFIIPVTPAALVPYRKARPLGFRDGSLVKAISDSRLYLISERRKCPVGNPDFLKAIGVKSVTYVSDYELSLHAEGGVIN